MFMSVHSECEQNRQQHKYMIDKLSNDVLIDQHYKISITYMYNGQNSNMNERRNGERCPNIPVFVICLRPTRISRNLEIIMEQCTR